MSHYFIEDPTLEKEPKIVEFDIFGHKVKVVSDKGTFSKYRVDLGTSIFIKTLVALPLKGNTIDLGCGNGIIGISLKKIFNDNINIDFSDINSYCIELTKKGLNLNNISGEVFVSDGFNNINKNYDYILLNSPISCGKEICYKLYKEAKSHLNEMGKLLIVIRKDKGALSHVKYLSSLFENVEIINKEKGYFIISNY